jgi:DNA-binding MarR family transcriptional regulator
MVENGTEAPPTAHVVLTLWRVSRALQTLLIAQARAGGLGMLDFLVLSRACDEGGVLPLEVGRELGLNSSTMTGLADRLEGNRLIRRVPHSTDRRLVVLEATKKGRQLRDKTVEPLMADVVDAVERLAPSERALLDGFLGDMAALMTAHLPSLPARRSSSRARTSTPRRTRPGASPPDAS